MSHLKVILLCSSRFAIPAMQQLIFFNQVAVVAIPGHCEEFIDDANAMLTGSRIPILKLNKANFVKQLKDAIVQYDVNIGIVITFTYKIPSSVFTLPEKGFYNIHPGPLPEYRGPDPVFHQIKNREKQAGVTIHRVDDGLDTGDVFIKEMILLDTGDTYGSLTTKLANVAAKLTDSLMKLAEFNITIPLKKQDEKKAVVYKRQEAKDIIIDWYQMNADSIIALINAGNPWNKGAVSKINNTIVRLLEAQKIQHDITNQMPGTITGIDSNGLIISTINNQSIYVSIIYMEEGFFNAGRLLKKGFTIGSRFE